MDILVTYDVAVSEEGGPKRLRKLASVCEKYGQRVQWSVFECRLSPTRLARMLGEVRDVIDPGSDSVIVYRFPGDLGASRTRLGRDGHRDLDEPWIV